LPLETATYISDLVTSNPAASDGMNNADDHMRLIKAAIKTTFPNITGAVTATQAQINGAGNIFTNGAGVLADAGAFFKTNSTDGFTNVLAGDIDVQLQGNLAFTFQRAGGVNTFKAFGGVTATGEIKGPGITPIGAAVMWFDDTLPTDTVGGNAIWAWANGQVISNAATVCPILLSRWGNRFGGNGVTTMGLPNMQEVVPVGKSTMGGASSPGLLASISSGVKTVLNSIFGNDTKTLLGSDLPNFAPSFSGTTGTVSVSQNFTGAGLIGSASNGIGGIPTTSGNGFAAWGPNAYQVASISPSGNFTPAGTVGSINGGVTQTAFGLSQPTKVVNWIIRIG
jgi:microcystin-dependent protein